MRRNSPGVVSPLRTGMVTAGKRTAHTGPWKSLTSRATNASFMLPERGQNCRGLWREPGVQKRVRRIVQGVAAYYRHENSGKSLRKNALHS